MGIVLKNLAFYLLITGLFIQPDIPAYAAEYDPETGSQSASESDDARRVNRLGDVASEEWEMDLSVPDSEGSNSTDTQEYDLPDPEQNERLQRLLSTLATRPGNQSALAQLDEFLSGVLEQAGTLGDQSRLEEMHRLLKVIQNVNPRKSGLKAAFERHRNLQNVSGWLSAASRAFEENRILEPSDDCAVYFLDKVLDVDSDNALALGGKSRAQGILLDRARAAGRELDFELAEEWLYEASLLTDAQGLVDEARGEVVGYQMQQADEIEGQVRQSIADGEFDYAEFILIDLVALLGNDARVATLREQLKSARTYGQYTPGQVIQDPFKSGSGSAPAMVVVKSGSFLMGSADSESGHEDHESPQHRVTIQRGFALGLQEVTVGQFRKFMEATSFKTIAEVDGYSRVYDESSGRITKRDRINWTHDYEGNRATDNLPVIHVSWHDAQAYTAWLSEQTGLRYRLPSESEFEYALRAGSVTRYWWGEDRPEQLVENLTGMEDRSVSDRAWSSGFRRYGDGFWGPAPGASFAPNGFGLHDMAGNVSEWVEDCWHQTFVQAPDDGSAWVNPGCQKRVLRGGYWASAPEQSRSAARLSASSIQAGPQIGFRVVRDL